MLIFVGLTFSKLKRISETSITLKANKKKLLFISITCLHYHFVSRVLLNRFKESSIFFVFRAAVVMCFEMFKKMLER